MPGQKTKRKARAMRPKRRHARPVTPRKRPASGMPHYSPPKCHVIASPEWTKEFEIKVNHNVVFGAVFPNLVMALVVFFTMFGLSGDIFAATYSTMFAWTMTTTITVGYFIAWTMFRSANPHHKRLVTTLLLFMLLFIYLIVFSVLGLPVFHS